MRPDLTPLESGIIIAELFIVALARYVKESTKPGAVPKDWKALLIRVDQ